MNEKLLHPSQQLLFLVTVLDTRKPRANQADWVPLKAKDKQQAIKMAKARFPPPFKVTRAKRVSQEIAQSVLSELKLMEQREAHARLRPKN